MQRNIGMYRKMTRAKEGTRRLRRKQRTVAKVKNEAFQELYEHLETKEELNKVFQIAKQR